MKCKDCKNVICEHRTSDAERECVYETTTCTMSEAEAVINRGLRFSNGRLYTVEEHQKPNRNPYEVNVDVTDEVLEVLYNAYSKKMSEAKQAAIVRQLKNGL